MIVDLTINEDDRDAALVVLSSMKHGASDAAVHKDTSLSLSAIAPYAKRLRKNGVWRKDGRIATEHIGHEDADDEMITIEFLMLVAVARGFVQRAKAERDALRRAK